MIKSKLLSNLFNEIKYFLLPLCIKNVVIDPISYARIEYAFINNKSFPFYSGDLYITTKGIFSFEKKRLRRIRYKVWIGTIPISGVETRIAIRIQNDVHTVVLRNYYNWVFDPDEGPVPLHTVKV